MTDKTLTDLVLERADADPELAEDAKELILAALLGDDALGSVLLTSPGDTGRRGSPLPEPGPPPVGAYLTDIKVAGFRGIGAEATLSLHPGPGLTVVTGRNGSGKSSFAEALELALTGDSYRWQKRHAHWSSDWRNLHQPAPCAIRVGLAVDDFGAATVGVDWADGATLSDRSTWLQRVGERRERGLTALGWNPAIDVYRPILSYEEMGGLLQAGPSQLYDALARILGLEQITDAAARLVAALKKAEELARETKERGQQLKAALAGVDDDRAKAALAELAKRTPDLGVLTALATGATQDQGPLARLRILSRAAVPLQDSVSQVVADLRAGVQAVADHGARSAEREERRTTLLSQALELHSSHGDQSCPVCAEGTLDVAWRERATAELARESAEIAQLRAAREQLVAARQQARELIGRYPAIAAPTGVALATIARAEEALRRWLDVPADDLALAEHLTQRHLELVEAFAALRIEAAEAITRLEDAWAPLARQLARWLELRSRADAQDKTVRAIKAACEWVKNNAAALRNERLEPLANRSKEIWAALRQESNVDLGAITLEGQGTRRHVELRAELDGEHAGALGVMSQGELHALALALFLPRATADCSPFRFVVLDDPIQAMDSEKIDGFARLLADIARDRQVVVFSHDDRLPEVLRRMAIPGARILEISRGFGSAVEVRLCLDPARRYVSDATALANDRAVPPDVQARVLPGLCRMAVEAAARDVFYARSYAAGANRAVIEAQWLAATRTRKRLGLALDGRDSQWCEHRSWRQATLRVCGPGVHTGVGTDPRGVVSNLRRTVEDLLEERP
ncbi:AAA family ATPase [Amycolatopsis sp. NPDC059021]|uniref:AAA family ATPase n=1 Tax=Amycolatopsis sp. NPDC059021 TaxID=3346704 RepID=UPI00367108F0